MARTGNGKMRIDDIPLLIFNVIYNDYIIYSTAVQLQQHVTTNMSSLDNTGHYSWTELTKSGGGSHFIEMVLAKTRCTVHGLLQRNSEERVAHRRSDPSIRHGALVMG